MEKEKYNLKYWKKKSKNLKDSYLRFEMLLADCKKHLKSNFYISQTGSDIVGVQPYELIEVDEHHNLRDGVFYHLDNKKYIKFDMKKMVKILSKKLAESLSPQKLLTDVLYNKSPEDVKELFERAIIRKGKVKEREGCYKLTIGGRLGSPMELMLTE